MRNRVVIFLRGGLGNQLFQICMGERLRLDYGCHILYSDILLGAGLFARSRTLRENFAQKAGLPNAHYRYLRGVFVRGAISILRVISASLKREVRLGKLLCSEAAISRDLTSVPNYLDAPGFEEVNDQDSLRIKRIIESIKPSISNELGLFSALHIRLGDYLSLQHIYGQPSKTYLDRAFSHLRQNIEKGVTEKVVLFSDEPTKARDYIPTTFPRDKVIMSNEICKSDFDEFLLMSQAQEIWIANSTFSWWAARISSASDVYFPQEFRGPILNLPQYSFPSNWKGQD